MSKDKAEYERQRNAKRKETTNSVKQREPSIERKGLKTTKTESVTKPTNTISIDRATRHSSINASSSKVSLNSSRDPTSSRVTKEKYFPKKYPFSSRLHEKQKDTESESTVSANRSQKNYLQDRAKENSSPKLKRERTITKVSSEKDKKNKNEPQKKIRDQIAKTTKDDKVERPRTATIRKGKSETVSQLNDISITTKSKKVKPPDISDSPRLSKGRSLETHPSTSKFNPELSIINTSIQYKPLKTRTSKTVLDSPKSNNKYPQKNTDSPKSYLSTRKQNSTSSKNHEISKRSKQPRDIPVEIIENTKAQKYETDSLSSSKCNSLEPSSITLEQPSTSKNSDDYEYEDDFDSYESDFEQYKSSDTTSDISTDASSTDTDENIEITPKRVSSSETDEERKLDSGTYDLPELKHKQVLDNIKEAIEKENFELNNKKDITSNLASLSDEGFDEKFSLNNGFINFTERKKKLKKNIRGHNLMNMIRLDAVSYNLFDMKPISYDEFMHSFGRSGTLQVSSQTCDDNLNIEVQTESIQTLNKWTQYPVRLPKNEQDYNYFGVGEDPPILKENSLNFENSKKLDNFILKAGKLMMTLFEKKQNIVEKIHQNEKQIPFSNGYQKLNINSYPFLSGRSVTYINFANDSILLTIHKSNTEVYMNPDEQLLSRSTICIWNLLEPMYPEKILVSSGEIVKACFDNKFNYLIFAGIKDGALSVWDLREHSNLHRSVYEDKLDRKITMRCPTYTTTATQEFDVNIHEIVTIQTLNTANTDEMNNDIISLQLCTLDEIGTISIWSVIQRQNSSHIITEDQGLVPWGTIVLVQGLTISLQSLNPDLKELQCFDLKCSDKDSNHLYVATNYGILHCLTSGMKPKPKIYTTETDAGKSVSCIEMCPFSATHFLSGSNNGNIRLHSRYYERCLMNLRSAEEDITSEEKIEIIQWSKSRPCVFYVKDSSNYIHVWDLLSSDMYPVYSIPFREDITSVKLSNIQNGNQTYMAISTKRGNVFLHTINSKFGQRSEEQFILELKTFLNYLNRL